MLLEFQARLKMDIIVCPVDHYYSNYYYINYHKLISDPMNPETKSNTVDDTMKNYVPFKDFPAFMVLF